MTLQRKICNINEAPNLAMGWADAVISIHDSNSIAVPTFPNLKHLVLNFDVGVLNGDPQITSDHIEDMISFIKELEDGNHLLIQSRNGLIRASSIAYISLMIENNWSPASALYNIIELNPNAMPDESIIAAAEKHLHNDNKFSHFLAVWKSNN